MRLSGVLLFLVSVVWVMVEVAHARAVRPGRSKKQGRSRDRESGGNGNRRPEQSPSCFLMTHARAGEKTCQPSLVEIMNVLKPCTDQRELSAHLEKVIAICRFDKVKWQLEWKLVRLSGNGVYTLDAVKGPPSGPVATTTGAPKSKSVVKKVQNGDGKLEEVEYVYEYVYDEDNPEDPGKEDHPDAGAGTTTKPPGGKDDHFRYEEPSMGLPDVDPEVKEAGQSLLAAEGEELHHLDKLKAEETEGLQRLQQIRQKEVEELEHIEVLKEVEKTEMKMLEKITDDILEKKEIRQEIDGPNPSLVPHSVLDNAPTPVPTHVEEKKTEVHSPETDPTPPSWAPESVQPQQDSYINTEQADENTEETSPNPWGENQEIVQRPDEAVQPLALPLDLDPRIPEPKTEEDLKDKARKEDEFLYGENVVDAAAVGFDDDTGSPTEDVQNEDEVIAMANNSDVEDDQDEDYDSSEEAEKGNYFVAATNEITQPDEGQPSLQLESHHENDIDDNVESEDNPESPLQEEKVLQSEAMIGTV